MEEKYLEIIVEEKHTRTKRVIVTKKHVSDPRPSAAKKALEDLFKRKEIDVYA